MVYAKQTRAEPERKLAEAKPERCNLQGKLIDCYAGSWQERAPSPGIPISFTQENPIPQPRSPLVFSVLFNAQIHRELDKPLSKDQKHRLRIKAKNQEKDQQLAVKDGQLAHLLSETEMLKQQILRTNDELAHLRSENEILKSVMEEQFARLRSQNEMLRSYYEQLARLISEIEMLRNNKDEQLARLIWEIEMLRKEIAFIKH
ncbi:hypothetical protein V6N13_023915 [Hibiscus sabdariffa]|uniref:Uncharacterized protein n=1 Tax=Hibiscus sabdariffa TaxID=183260 RepID=A0ABR2PNH4_9ROSI